MRVCTKGHISGFKRCSCGAKAETVIVGTQPPVLDKKAKRAATAAIRAEGLLPVADLRSIPRLNFMPWGVFTTRSIDAIW